MIGYVTLGTDDIEAARTFYDALLAEIGATRMMEAGEEDGGFTMYGTGMEKGALALIRPHDGKPQQPGNGNMVALHLGSRAQVDALHAKALALGGTDEGAPGLRGDPANGFYFAYFRDPEGHKLAAFAIGPA